MPEDDPEKDDAPESSPELAKLPLGALSRGMKLGRAMLGAVGRTAAGKMLGRAATPGAVGTSLAATLGQMKGLPMKLGQMLSYVDLELPEELRSALGRLQEQSVPMRPEVAARTIEEDLGAPPERLFAAWQERPFAAASIGQVHRARLRDGREVAVKVRYPQIARALHDDLGNLELLRHVVALAAPGLDAAALLEELRERSLEECDYRREAENQSAFREFFAGNRHVLVPEVHPGYSSERVLTTEFVVGRRFLEFSRDATDDERNRAARVIHDFAFQSVYRMGALNCDPHPGNYLMTPGGVAFLDFGCVRRFPAVFVQDWRTMVRSALERNLTRFRESVVRVGLAAEQGGFDFETHYRQYLFLIRPWLTGDALALTPEFVTRTYRTLVLQNPNRKKLRLPREFLFVNRLQWGLYSVLAELRSTASLRSEILDILYDPGEPRPEPFSDSELRYYLGDLEPPR